MSGSNKPHSVPTTFSSAPYPEPARKYRYVPVWLAPPGIRRSTASPDPITPQEIRSITG